MRTGDSVGWDAIIFETHSAGLGGQLGDGRQFVSWIHETDFGRAAEFLIERADLSGAINVCAPHPLPQADFARGLRRAWHVRFGLPAAGWMVKMGTWAMNADSELVMKSRRVVPGRLMEAGFEFQFPEWAGAAADLVGRVRPSRPFASGMSLR